MRFQDRYRILFDKMAAGKFKDSCADIDIREHEKDDFTDIDLRNSIGVGENVSEFEIFKHFLQDGLGHFVQSKRKDFFYELLSSAMMLKQPQSFVGGKTPFLVYDFIAGAGKKGLNTQSISFSKSADKKMVIKKVDEFIRTSPKTEVFYDRILQIADEMITNALYNAPIDKYHNYLFQNHPRNKSVEYPEGTRAAKLFVYYNENKLLIGCDDPFGSLETKDLLERLTEVYNPAGKPKPRSPDRPGLGFKLMIDNCMSLVLVVKPKVHTTVACSFELGLPFKTMESLDKHFHFCTY